MSDTPKLMVRQRDNVCKDCLLMGVRGRSCRHTFRPPSVAEVVAWLQEQNVGEEVEAVVFEDEEFGEWHRVLHVEREGRYLVVPLDPKEGT